jgi:hypothetical protein
MTVNTVLKNKNIEVSKKMMNTNSRKFSRYEFDAVYAACCYVSFFGSVFLDMNIWRVLAIGLIPPCIKIIAERWSLKHSGIAVFKGDIIELVSLLDREGLNLLSSNNIYVFSSAKLSLAPQVRCIAEVMDEGIKITTEQFLLEKWVENDGRINVTTNQTK